MQFKIFETVTKFKWISREKQSVDLKNLDFVKVFYFFTMPNDSISTLQQNTVLEFKLTEGKSFTHDQVLASGKIQPFLQFNETTFQEKHATVKDFEFYSTKIEYFNVTLFSQKLPQQSLRVVVGLKKDYETRSENIRLQLYQGVYIPTDSYYNCDPLPQTWIELFYARQHLQNTQNQSQIQSQDFNQDSTRKLPAFEQAYEDQYVINNITKDFFVQQKLEEEMQYLPINKLMRYERQLTSEREKSKTKFDHVKSKKDHDTFSSMERKRLNLEQSRLSRLITDQSQLQNLSTFRDERESDGFKELKRQSSVGNINLKGLRIKLFRPKTGNIRQRPNRNFDELPLMQDTFDYQNQQLQQTQNFTIPQKERKQNLQNLQDSDQTQAIDQLYKQLLDQSQLCSTKGSHKKKHHDISSINQQQNAQNSSTDTANTRLLKKIKSVENFHHKKTQSLVPYLQPIYKKALKKMLVQYNDGIISNQTNIIQSKQKNIIYSNHEAEPQIDKGKIHQIEQTNLEQLQNNDQSEIKLLNQPKEPLFKLKRNNSQLKMNLTLKSHRQSKTNIINNQNLTSNNQSSLSRQQSSRNIRETIISQNIKKTLNNSSIRDTNTTTSNSYDKYHRVEQKQKKKLIQDIKKQQMQASVRQKPLYKIYNLDSFTNQEQQSVNEITERQQ